MPSIPQSTGRPLPTSQVPASCPTRGYLQSSAELSDSQRGIIRTQEAKRAVGQHLECVAGGRVLEAGLPLSEWGLAQAKQSNLEADYGSVTQGREREMETQLPVLKKKEGTAS